MVKFIAFQVSMHLAKRDPTYNVCSKWCLNSIYSSSFLQFRAAQDLRFCCFCQVRYIANASKVGYSFFNSFFHVSFQSSPL